MSLLIVLDNTFIRKGSELDIRAEHYIYYKEKCSCYNGRALHFLACEVSLLIGPNIRFIKNESVFTIWARHYIY